MPDDDMTWQGRYRQASERFAWASERDGCTWEQWREAFLAAETVKAEALGTQPRQPSFQAWKTRHSLSSCIGRINESAKPRKTVAW